MKDEFLQHCHDNNLEGVTDCLSRGVDVNTVSLDGEWSGLTIAAKKNYIELLEILLSHPHIQTSCNVSALKEACARGNSAIVSRLVQVPGLDINYQDLHGITAARMAVTNGRTECVRILAETDRVDWNKGRPPPLYRALERGHSDIVDIIVQQSNIRAVHRPTP